MCNTTVFPLLGVLGKVLHDTAVASNPELRQQISGRREDMMRKCAELKPHPPPERSVGVTCFDSSVTSLKTSITRAKPANVNLPLCMYVSRFEEGPTSRKTPKFNLS